MFTIIEKTNLSINLQLEDLRCCQFINHIKNSHQLTSKNYLNKNLKKSLCLWPNLNSHYPKCYDIAISTERQQFFQQFVKQFMMCLLQKIYFYLKKHRQNDVQRYQQFYVSLLDEKGEYQTQNKNESCFRKKQFRKIELQNYKQYDSTCLVHMNLMIIAFRYWRYLRKKLQMNTESCSFHFLVFTMKQFEYHLVYLQQYSKKVIPAFDGTQDQYFTKQFYATPSQITIQRVVKQHVYFQHLLGRQWQVYGNRNIWIIKPCSASKGNGIYLQNNAKQILFNSNKGIQSKIVQKYIENPLIFKSTKYRQITNKKFDIRQWVLLRSVDPLQIYMFSHCYVRICSEQYNLDDIKNLKSHLTNYSFNKQYYKNTAQSVLDHNSFINLLKQQYDVDYQAVIKPKIIQIVINSIKSSQQLLQDYSQRCFSLLGYDILLDEQCNPWLLEVNMSPACEERTQWLKQYLHHMGKGLLDIILPSHYLSPPNTKVQSSLDRYHHKTKTEAKEQSEYQQHVRKNTEEVKQTKNELEELNFSEDNSSGNQQINQEIQITYADFINQHNVQTMSPKKDQSLGIQTPTYYFQNQYCNNPKNNLQFLIHQNQQSPHHQQDFLQLQNASNQSETQKKLAQNQFSPLYHKNLTNTVLAKAQFLKWQLICLQEYHNQKKDKDPCLQIVGIKISPKKLHQRDQKIDQQQEYQQFLQESTRKIQKTIRAFLIYSKSKVQFKKDESYRNLKVNYSRFIRKKRQKESKSVYCAIEGKSSSIQYDNFINSKQEEGCQSVMLERAQTSRNKTHLKNSARIKSSIDIKVGDTLRQFFKTGKFIYQQDLIRKKIQNVVSSQQKSFEVQLKQSQQQGQEQRILNGASREFAKQSFQYAQLSALIK